MTKKNEHGDILTFLIGVAIAAAMIIAGFMLTKICWPLLKWVAKKAWAKMRGPGKSEQVDDAPQIEEPVVDSGLRTPEIFKGHANLAPMKDFRY